MAQELDSQIHNAVSRKAVEGDALLETGNFAAAIKAYEEAVDLLPEPKEIWEAATWLFTAIGDAHFQANQMEFARKALLQAMHCPGATGNPFIHLRLGQVQFELGNYILAADELARAYMGGGSEIFENEDPRYFEIVRSKLKRPPNGW